MKSKRYITVLLSMVFLLSTGSILLAQEEEEQGNVFTISTFKVRFDQVDEVLDLWEKEFKPIAEQNDLIKSVKVFRHLWGPDWTIVIIREYENFAAISSAQEKSNELRKKKYPDKKKRDEIMKKNQSYLLGHTDAIVREVPKLRK